MGSTSIERAKELLARLESGTEGVYLVPVKDILAGYISAVDALGGLMEIAETAMPDSYFRSDRRTRKGRKAIAEFDIRFPPDQDRG